MSGDGTLQELNPDQQAKKSAQFDREVAYARKSHTHLWVAITSHVVSVNALRTMADGPMLFDAETLRELMFGCFICEQTYRPELLTRRCKGEPTT